MMDEEKIFREIAQATDLNTINLPQSEEFFENAKGERLHVRTHWPAEDVPLRGVVFFLHGYNSHFNRPTQTIFAEKLTKEGFLYAGLDHYGHGYSAGPRAYVHDVDAFVDNAVQVVLALFSNVGKDPNGRFLLRKGVDISASTPLFVMGQSMGGPLSLLVADRIEKQHKHINVQGNILLCPAIGISTSPVIRFVMDSFVVPVWPESPIPSALAPSLPESASWTNEDYIRYVQNDRFPANPKGLGWSENIRFGTASNILALSDRAVGILSKVSRAVLLFHDPEDLVTKSKCSDLVIQKIATPADKKLLVPVPKGAHDLVSNKAGFVSSKIVEWLLNL